MRDRAQAVRVGGVDQGPDRGHVEAGRVDDDLDVVDPLGHPLGDVGLRLVGVGHQALRPPHPLGVRAGRVGGPGAARADVGDAGRPRSDATSSGGQVPMSSPVVTPLRASAASVASSVRWMWQSISPGSSTRPSPSTVVAPGRVGPDPVAVDDDGRGLEQPVAVEHPHVGQRDLVHVVSAPCRPPSMAMVVSRNSVRSRRSGPGSGPDRRHHLVGPHDDQLRAQPPRQRPLERGHGDRQPGRRGGAAGPRPQLAVGRQDRVRAGDQVQRGYLGRHPVMGETAARYRAIGSARSRGRRCRQHGGVRVAVAEDQVGAEVLGPLGLLDPAGGGRPGAVAVRSRAVEVVVEQLRRQRRHVRGRLVDHPPVQRPAFGFVGVEQRRAAPSGQRRRQLPAQVDRVADAGVEAVAAERRVEVGGVADQEHPPAPAPVHQLHPRRPRVGADHLDRKLASERPADQPRGVEIGRPAVDPERDQPPQAVAVDRPHHPRRLPVEQPGLHGGRVRDGADQLPAAEHQAGVGPQRGRPDVPGADLLADDAAGAVGPDHVLGRHRDRDPGRVEQGRVHRAVRRHRTPRHPARPRRGSAAASPAAGPPSAARPRPRAAPLRARTAASAGRVRVSRRRPPARAPR